MMASESSTLMKPPNGIPRNAKFSRRWIIVITRERRERSSARRMSRIVMRAAFCSPTGAAELR
jgi:hypothetical protein